MSKDLIQVLTAIKATLEEANQSGVITDTIWHGPGETLWDFIDNRIDRHRSSVESVELPEPECWIDGGDLEQLGKLGMGGVLGWPDNGNDPRRVQLYTASTVRSLIAAAVEREREAIIQMMPGGHSVAPQMVCDAIRARGEK